MRLSSKGASLGCAIALGAVGFWAFERHVTAQAHALPWSHILSSFDPFGLYFPMLEYAASSLRAGHLPLWNPYQLGGIPFLATFYAGVLYPLNAPYLFLPVDRAMEVTVLGHVLLAGWLAALYARLALGVSRTASLAAGIVFMVSSHTLWAVMAYNQLYSIPWIPLLFLGVDRAIRTPAPIWSLAVAGGIALPILGGNLQVLSYEAYALLPYGIACAAEGLRLPGGPARARCAFVTLGLGGLLGVLLAAPQLLPTLEISPLTLRPPGGLTPQQIEPLFGVAPPGLRVFLDGARDSISTVFAGVVIWLLLPFAFSLRGTRARAIALALAAVFFGLVSYGLWTLVGRLYIRLPTGDWFRVLQRSWIVSMFSLGALSALGLEALLRPAARRSGQAARALTIAAITGALVILAPGAIKGIVLAAGLVLLLLAAPFQSRRARSLAALGTLALLALELDRSIPVNPSVVPFTGQNFRALYVAQEPFLWAQRLDPDLRIIHLEYIFVHTTTPKLGTLFRVPDFQDHEPFIPSRYLRWCEQASGKSRKNDPNVYLGGADIASPFFNPKFLDYAGVGYVILFDYNPAFPAPPSIHGFFPLRTFRLPRPTDLGARDPVPEIPRLATVFRNPTVWPRAFLARRVLVVRTGEDALKALESLPRGAPPAAVIEAPPSMKLPGAIGEEGRVRIESLEPDRVVIGTSAPKEAVLVLADTHFPGWRADIDGKEIPILRANYLFRAVPVPAGDHTVTFRYEPRSVPMGLGLGATGIALALGLSIAAWRGGHARREVRAGMGEKAKGRSLEDA